MPEHEEQAGNCADEDRATSGCVHTFL
jgi:hypothetical protein